MFHSIKGLGANGNNLVERQFVRDPFGNVSLYTKKITYCNGRSFIYNRSIKFFNSENKFVKLRNQLNQKECYEFKINRWLIKIIQFDRTPVLYSRDACGQATEIEYSNGKTQITYECKNRLSRIQ